MPDFTDLTVAPQTVVTLIFRLHEDNEQGAVLDFAEYQWPLIFLFDSGKMLPAFEQQLLGLARAQTFDFTLAPEQAYGLPDPTAIQQMPVELFLQNGEYAAENLRAGQYISLKPEPGQPHQSGKIVKAKGKMLTIDFNHPMAGKTLYFRGKVLSIRPARPEELERNHYIEPDGIRF